ncbi:TonB-dependent receptor [Azonexus hydrophilus]
MNSIPFPRTACALALSLAFTPLFTPNLHAEETEQQLANVVVSASRLEQNTLEAPASVSVVTAERLEASGSERLMDAVNAKVPGLYMRGNSASNSRMLTAPNISLRGQSNGRVKIMLDGIDVSDGNSGAFASLVGVDFSELERIEVVPGVNSALYGSDAVGGVVNMISKVPTKQETRLKYIRGFSEGGREGMSFNYGNSWDNGLALTLGVKKERMNGFDGSDLVVLPVTGGGTGANALQGGKLTQTVKGVPAYIVGDKGAVTSNMEQYQGKLFYRLNAQSKFHIGYSRFQGENSYKSFNNYLTKNGAAVTFPIANPSINGDKLATINQTSFWSTSYPSERKEDRYQAGFDGKLGNGMDLKVNLGYFDRDYYYVSNGTLASGTTFDAGPGKMTTTPNTTFDGSAQIGFGIGQQHYLLLGTSLTRTTMDRKVYQVSNWRHPEGSKTAVTETSTARSLTKGVFFQDQYFATDDLTLYFGGRYDRWSTRGKVWTGTASTSLEAPERTESAFSPKLAAVYRLSPSLSLRSSWGKAFRAPSNNELYATPSLVTSSPVGSRYRQFSDPNLKPEKAKSWDIGLEAALPNQGFVKVAYFDTRLTDMIYRRIVPHTAGIANIDVDRITTNAGEAKVNGIEFSTDIALTHWLRATASYTYTKSKVTQGDGAVDGDLKGKTLTKIPKNMAALGLDAHWGGWRAVLDANYIGKQYANEDNSDTVDGVYGGITKGWMSNLRISYQIDPRLSIAVRINNLFDKEYYEFYQTPGRHAVIELTGKF